MTCIIGEIPTATCSVPIIHTTIILVRTTVWTKSYSVTLHWFMKANQALYVSTGSFLDSASNWEDLILCNEEDEEMNTPGGGAQNTIQNKCTMRYKINCCMEQFIFQTSIVKQLELSSLWNLEDCLIVSWEEMHFCKIPIEVGVSLTISYIIPLICQNKAFGIMQFELKDGHLSA